MCVVFRQCRVNSVSVTCSQMTVEDSVCRASAPQLLRDNWAHFLSIQYPHVEYLKVKGWSQQGACTHINDTRPRIQTRCDTVGTHSQHTLIPSALFATGFLLMAQLFINLNIRGFSLHIYFSLCGATVRAAGSRHAVRAFLMCQLSARMSTGQCINLYS